MIQDLRFCACLIAAHVRGVQLYAISKDIYNTFKGHLGLSTILLIHIFLTRDLKRKIFVGILMHRRPTPSGARYNFPSGYLFNSYYDLCAYGGTNSDTQYVEVFIYSFVIVVLFMLNRWRTLKLKKNNIAHLLHWRHLLVKY